MEEQFFGEKEKLERESAESLKKQEMMWERRLKLEESAKRALEQQLAIMKEG